MLVGIVLAVLSPLAAIVYALFSYRSIHSSLSLALVVGVAMGLTFYSVRTGTGADIYRHMSFLSLYRQVDLFHCFDAGHYKSHYVWDLYCWIIAQFGDDYLLQAATGFVSYTAMSYILFDAAKLYEVKISTLLFCWFVMISFVPFATIVIGLRNGLAVALCALIVYLDCRKKIPRPVAALFLAFTVMIHASSLLLLGAWMVLPFAKKRPLVFAVLFFVVCMLAAVVSQRVLIMLPGTDMPFVALIRNAMESAFGYTQESEWAIERVASLNGRVTQLLTLLAAGGMALRVGLAIRAGKSIDESYRFDSARLLGFTLITALASLGLMVAFFVNGARVLRCAFITGSVLMLIGMHELPSRKGELLFLLDTAIFLVAVGSFLLNGYTIYYISLFRDLSPLFSTLFLGVLGLSF